MKNKLLFKNLKNRIVANEENIYFSDGYGHSLILKSPKYIQNCKLFGKIFDELPVYMVVPKAQSKMDIYLFVDSLVEFEAENNGPYSALQRLCAQNEIILTIDEISEIFNITYDLNYGRLGEKDEI